MGRSCSRPEFKVESDPTYLPYQTSPPDQTQMIWMLIAIGGGLGAVARHFLAAFVATRAATLFPAGTFVVNVVGCLAAGVLIGLGARSHLSLELRAFLMIGMLGGFTTFSAFSVETLLLVQSGKLAMALTYALGSVTATLVAVWLGSILHFEP